MWSSTEAIDGENNTKYGENNILISIADSERLIVFWFRIEIRTTLMAIHSIAVKTFNEKQTYQIRTTLHS